MPATGGRPPAVAVLRAVAAVCLALLPALAVTTVLAGPAVAVGGNVTAPEAGRVVTTQELVPVTATVEGPTAGPVELRLAGPTDEGDGPVVARLDDPAGGELRYDLDPACPPDSGVCADAEPARNGTWTAELTGGATDRRSFVLEVPPAAPRDVTAVPADGGTVLVSWAVNREPDLVAYAVGTSSGAALVDPVDPTASCTVERCSVAVEPPPGEGVTVTAVRTTCPGCTATLRSSASSPSAGAQQPAPTAQATGAQPTAGTTGPGSPPSPGSPATPSGGTGGVVGPGGFGRSAVAPELLPAPDVPAPVVAPPLVAPPVLELPLAVQGRDPGLLPVPAPLAPRGTGGVGGATAVAAPLAAALLLAVAVAHTVVAVPGGGPRRRWSAARPPVVATAVRVPEPELVVGRTTAPDSGPAGGPVRTPVSGPVVPAVRRRTPVPTPARPRTVLHQDEHEEHVLTPPPLARRLRRRTPGRRRPARAGGPLSAEDAGRARGPRRRT